jgi:Lipopolysaccharide assembly protein A domain
LLVFILENGHTVAVSFFGADGHLPLGVALLLAAVLGVLLVAIRGTARIVQLRITARRHRRLDAAVIATQDQTPEPPPGMLIRPRLSSRQSVVWTSGPGALARGLSDLEV